MGPHLKTGEDDYQGLWDKVSEASGPKELMLRKSAPGSQEAVARFACPERLSP